MHEFSDHGLHPTPVCDLVKVTDPQWQPSIEAYLCWRRLNLDSVNFRSATTAYFVTNALAAVRTPITANDTEPHKSQRRFVRIVIAAKAIAI